MNARSDHRAINTLFFVLFIAGQVLFGPGGVEALSPEQVMSLKKAGVSDRTIQLMIRQEMAAKDGTSDADVKEIRDGNGQVTTVYSSGPSGRSMGETEREEVEEAWKMLQHNIIIDGRR